jgi:hypothetical protein
LIHLKIFLKAPDSNSEYKKYYYVQKKILNKKIILDIYHYFYFYFKIEIALSIDEDIEFNFSIFGFTMRLTISDANKIEKILKKIIY